jgi:hypothetical protein
MARDPSEFRRHEWVDRELCFVDQAYQREENPAWVAKTAKRFDPDLFDPLAVSLRPDGRYAIIDGQHRFRLAEMVGMDKVPVLVHEDLTPEQESSLFRKFQSERRQLRPYDEFKAALFEAEPWAVDCSRMATEFGFKIGTESDREQSVTISGIRALWRVWDTGPEILHATLKHIAEGWQVGVRQRTDASVIEGVGAFVASHQGKYDPERLRRVFAGEGLPEALSPEVIRARAAKERAASAGKGIAADGMFSRRWSVLYVVESAYNDSLSKENKRAGLLRKTRRPSEKRDDARRKRLAAA